MTTVLFCCCFGRQTLISMQLISENSLAMAHYVTGHVTKAEKSNMHKIWEEVSAKETFYSYSKLWSLVYNHCAAKNVVCTKLLTSC